ncbi:MAG TPA: DUF1207 domain-containing protein [Pirellulales bacterium]|nr:DUF1207 domain-containing protein [Pirellulales bacterium]
MFFSSLLNSIGLRARRRRRGVLAMLVALTSLLVVGAPSRADFEALPAERLPGAPEIALAGFNQPGDAVIIPDSEAPLSTIQNWDGAARGNGPCLEPQINAAPFVAQPEHACPDFYGSDAGNQEWKFQVLPDGLMYHTYFAGDREPRFQLVSDEHRGFGNEWDIALGGRVALLRYGTEQAWLPSGWELEMEGAVFPRLQPDGPSSPLIATDYRFGVPITYGDGPIQYKIGYYHLSSHYGDEWLILHPALLSQRINYVRDELLTGVSYYWLQDFRFYGDLGLAAANGGSGVGGAKPLEFQFGAEYSPKDRNDYCGAPFAAINSHLRQEIDFSGDLIVQTGWQWRNGHNGHVFRLGVEYFTGKSDQGEFYNIYEQRVGFGAWYDF